MGKIFSTTKQKGVANNIIKNSKLDKPLTNGEIVANSGYGVSMKKNSHVVINSEGVQAELKRQGFTEENAMQVVEDIMLNEDADNSSRLKATDQVFKVVGSYAPEKRQNMNINITEGSKDLQEMAKEMRENIRNKYKEGE